MRTTQYNAVLPSHKVQLHKKYNVSSDKPQIVRQFAKVVYLIDVILATGCFSGKHKVFSVKSQHNYAVLNLSTKINLQKTLFLGNIVRSAKHL